MLWLAQWTTWHYYRDGLRLHINPDKHLLRIFGGTPGVDKGVYEYWKAHGVRIMRFELAPGRALHDGTIGFIASVATFDLICETFDAGEQWGPQWVAPFDARHVWHPYTSAEEAEAIIADLLAMSYGGA